MDSIQAYVAHRVTSATEPPAIVFGEGTPGFDPASECTKGGPYMTSPWCVARVLEAFDETITRTENDVRDAVRAEPAKAQDPRVLAWNKIYSDWNSEEKILLARIQTAKDNSEWMEGTPDDEDESAKNELFRLEQWMDKTRDIRNALKDIKVALRPPQPTPEEIKKTYGDTPESPAEAGARAAKYLAIGAVAVAGAYALSQLSFFLPKRSK
jgi:hypothetical protein